MDKAAEMVIFARVVQMGSFSGAAKRLAISTSVASKHVTNLERRLGVRLINRTTRSLSLTEAGDAFYEHCARLVEEIEAAESAVSRLHAEPTGTLRITCTLTFGSLHVVPLISAFLVRYPRIGVGLSLNDRIVDLAEEGYDLAIRMTSNPHENLVARKLVPVRWTVCASPGYLDSHGTPNTPADLVQHNCLLSYLAGSEQWHFTAPNSGEFKVSVKGNLRVNSGMALREAALQGLGIVQVASYVVGRDIREGKLRPLLSEYATPTDSIYAVYLPNRFLPPKTRVFIDFLLEQYKSNPP
jgi:DNA-binding transcriptional LysR family regulator